MSDLSIDLIWQREDARFINGEYSNKHTVQYNETYELQADAAPDWGGDPNATSPEQALAAALSSCHMMTFLALAAKANWPVVSFQDHAVAHLGKILEVKCQCRKLIYIQWFNSTLALMWMMQA